MRDPWCEGSRVSVMTVGDAGPGPHVLQVRVQADEFESLRPLLLEGLDAGCKPHVDQRAGRGVSMQAYVAEDEVDRLRERGYEVEVLADATVAGLERLAEVGQGDRFEGGRVAPRGLGRKTGGRRTAE
jgi:hypothetical protein